MMCNPGKRGPQECTSKDIAFPLLWLAGSFEVLRLKVCEVLGKRRLSGEEYRDWIQNGAWCMACPPTSDMECCGHCIQSTRVRKRSDSVTSPCLFSGHAINVFYVVLFPIA